jgi:hypothetical protein
MTTVAVEGQRFGFRKTVFRKSWARGGAAEGGDFRTDSENAWGGRRARQPVAEHAA